MSENAIDSVKATPEPAAAKPKRKPGKAQPKWKADRYCLSGPSAEQG
jgi:hypothetical protein